MMPKFLFKIFFALIIVILSFVLISYINNKVFSNKYIAHALGEINGVKYSNTKEAFELSYKKGFRFFEIDLTITPDDEIVAFHSMWTKKKQTEICKKLGLKYIAKENFPTYKNFMKLKLKTKNPSQKLTQIDIYQVIDWMRKHKDIKFLFHFHENDPQKLKEAYLKIAKIANYDEQILDRIIAGSFKNVREDIFAIQSIGHIKNIEYYVKKVKAREEGYKDIHSIIKFLKDNNVNAVSVPVDVLLENPDELAELKKNDIYVYSFTTDDIKISQKLLKNGVDMIGTNYICPKTLFFPLKIRNTRNCYDTKRNY